MGVWDFATLSSPLLCMFGIFHDEQEIFKGKTKGLYPGDSQLHH